MYINFNFLYIFRQNISTHELLFHRRHIHFFCHCATLSLQNISRFFFSNMSRYCMRVLNWWALNKISDEQPLSLNRANSPELAVYSSDYSSLHCEIKLALGMLKQELYVGEWHSIEKKCKTQLLKSINSLYIIHIICPIGYILKKYLMLLLLLW